MNQWIPLIAAAVSFVVTALLGFIVIPFLKRMKFGQTILDIGPKWHKGKEGTPTMGGIMMAAGFVVGFVAALTAALLSRADFALELKDYYRTNRLIAGIALAFLMGAIGFIDDYIKVVKKRNLGLTARQKTFLQLLVAAAYLATLALGGMNETYLPFAGMVPIDHGIGLIFWPIALMFIYGFTNAVNLTDGVDGLASSVTLVVACAFMLAAGKLHLLGMNVLAATLAGACVGFIIWNAKPAKVFMGDTGSMFLGGMVVALSFGINRPVMLILAGCLYFIEALSVVIQVAYYKKTKKRLFKMSPIHHHFELCGWSEQKIVLVFSFVALVGCALALLPLYLN